MIMGLYYDGRASAFPQKFQGFQGFHHFFVSRLRLNLRKAINVETFMLGYGQGEGDMVRCEESEPWTGYLKKRPQLQMVPKIKKNRMSLRSAPLHGKAKSNI